jgi:hypothetical protein
MTMIGDDEQGDLFHYPERPGSVAGCDTSEAAADSLADDVLTRLRKAVWDFIRLRPYGATCDEVEIALDLRHQTASARIRELVLKDKLTITNQRRPTRSGRGARVYQVQGVG